MDYLGWMWLHLVAIIDSWMRCSPVGVVLVWTVLQFCPCCWVWLLIQLSGSDSVFQRFLLFSVLALSLALDPVLVVALSLVPDLVLELVLVHSASELCLALVPSWILVLSFLVSVPTLSWTLAWLPWCRYRPALTFWI